MPRRLIAYAALIVAAVALVARVPFRDISKRFGGNTLAIHFAKVLPGDDSRWAQPAFDDRAWPETLLYNRSDHGRRWIRKRIDLDARDETRALTIYVSILASHETYWDGVRIGTSDALDNFYALDRAQRARGTHLLAIRVMPGGVPSGFHGIAIGDMVPMIRSRTASQLIPIAGLGVFIVIGCYFLAIFVAARKRRDLVFALLCFAAGLLVGVETWRWIFGMPYTWQPARLLATDVLTFAIAWLLPSFFAIDFRLRRAPLWMAIFAVVLIVAILVARSGGSDARCLAMFAASISMCASILIESSMSQGWRILTRAIGVGAMAVSLVMGGYGFSDSAFFIAFCVLIVSLLVSMAREHESAKLRAARLEIELLQKSIQPHFLMNTLTAVMEWIEEDPAEGLRFLEALADELRIFGEVSKEKLIPLARELELCRSHLAIMSCRKGMRFELVSDGVATSATLPPATLHTLLENAITHNRYDGDRIVFRLQQRSDNGSRRYVLDAPLAKRASRETSEGLGLRYVRARLEESYPSRWSLDAGVVDDVWRTTIEVPA